MKKRFRLSNAGAFFHLWLSPWTVWMGRRYLQSHKSSRFLSFITVISILGVALGVTAMIVVLSVMDGFEERIRSRLMASDLHVLVTPTSEAKDFQNGFVPTKSGDAMEDFRKNPDVVDIWPVLSTEVILRSGRKVKGAVLKGMTEARADRLKRQLIETADPVFLKERRNGQSIRHPGISVGSELAYEMQLLPGDYVTLISPTETEGPLASVPRLRRFVVESIYQTGLPEQELQVLFTDLGNVESFLRKRDVVSQWEIVLKDFESAPEIAKQIQARFPEYRVRSWQQLNASLFSSLKLERFAMGLMLMFVIVVASFNIVTTLTLMVLEKKRDISILKAMGARHSQVAAIFLGEGLLIGTLGVLGGLILAYFICVLLDRFSFITLPDVYWDRTLPVAFNFGYYFWVALVGFIIVLMASQYPSRKAARLDPIEGIRED